MLLLAPSLDLPISSLDDSKADAAAQIPADTTAPSSISFSSSFSTNERLNLDFLLLLPAPGTATSTATGRFSYCRCSCSCCSSSSLPETLVRDMFATSSRQVGDKSAICSCYVRVMFAFP